MKKFILIFALVIFSMCSYAQTHITPNNEECWLLYYTEDAMDRPAYIVVVKTGEIKDEKIIVEKYLKVKDTKKALRDLTLLGFRIEAYAVETLKKIKKEKK
jgi:hypothetical protein